GGSDLGDNAGSVLSDIQQPEEGLIVVGYRIIAEKGEKRFKAACTSVYRRKAHEEWSVVQHSQVVIGAD
ncbi:MAG: hypothetical protein NWQ37_07945, partial [Marivita lacus]|nr:hypothetical protein [Marivita lacus]